MLRSHQKKQALCHLINPQIQRLITRFISNDARFSFSHCINTVYSKDYANYVWAVQLPKKRRLPVLALLAFDNELAAIPSHARTEMLIRMRYQWWRDAVNKAFKNAPPAMPVINALAIVLESHPLTRYRLQQIITTREEFAVSQTPPRTVSDLERFAEGTFAQLLLLQIEAAIGPEIGPDLNCAATALGRALGVSSILKSALTEAKRNRCLLPEELLASHGATQEDVIAGRIDDGIRNSVAQIAEVAKSRLSEARALKHVVTRDLRPLFLPAVACDSYLKTLENADFDPFQASISVENQFRYQLGIKWRLLTESY